MFAPFKNLGEMIKQAVAAGSISKGEAH
jgi:hypothetical protein